MSKYADVGLNIYKVRCMLGITQTQLAEKLSVSTSLVSMWESGKRTPTTEQAAKIADTMMVSLDYLLNAPRWIPVFQLP